jgi:hypothetical protein
MAIVKIVNWEGGSNARYDVNQMTPDERAMFDSEGRPLFSGAPGDGPDQWTPGLPGARGGSGPGDAGGGGGGGGFPDGALVAQRLAFAKKAYDQALARITNQRQTMSRSAGFTFDVDPETGVMRSMRVDPQSQYGGFQMLNRQQAQRDEAARGQAVERGLGSGGGLAAQMRSDARFQSGEEDAKFSSSLIDTMSQLALQQQDAKNAYDMEAWQARLDAARANQPRGGGGGGYGGDDDGQPLSLGLSPNGTAGKTGYLFGEVDALLNKPVPLKPTPAKQVKFNFTRRGGI